MPKIIGKIENFNPKKSYTGFTQPVNTVAAQCAPIVSAIAVVAAKASKHPSVLLTKKLAKRAKKEWKTSNPNHKDKLLTKFSCN